MIRRLRRDRRAAYASGRAPGLPLGAIGFSMGGAAVLRATARGAPFRAVAPAA